jgi:hypothetical protein
VVEGVSEEFKSVSSVVIQFAGDDLFREEALDEFQKRWVLLQILLL